MSAGHTKGPWLLDEVGDIIGSSEDVTIACVMSAGCLDEMCANAHLIAAAPTMLTALYRVREILTRNNYAAALERVDAAIAEATGQ